MRHVVLTTVLAKFQAQYEATKLNLEIFISQPKSIPEHFNFTEDVEALISQLAEIQDKIDQTKKLLES
jgi:hypothetical protein